jgi:rhodanese-related sulfurtransferase/predicted metal-dependent enzyme (double-stranded beta helix superfamily)
MTSSAMDERAAAVGSAVEQIKRLEAVGGVTRDALERIKAVVIALAERTELFPPEHFPIPEGSQGAIYRLSEEHDRRFALYASAGSAGKAQPPHNHTTWAVISGIYGDEHNVFYDRTDNRATPGIGRLARKGELTVRRGNACALMPDDFHTIEVVSAEPALHLHAYGMSLENLPERISFASSEGGAYRAFPANPNIVTPVVSPREVKAMLRDGGELALLDVREEGVFARSHLLFATPLPLSRLELDLAALVPRRSTRIVLIDDADGLAERAAALMMRVGYRNLAVLAGGVAAWRDAGYELFSGVHVPSKAFGEVVEHKTGTPNLSAQELKAKLDAGEKLVILDSRPMDEYRAMSIPGGIDCPGAELVRFVHDVAPSSDTLVVVNCAGRTRSIIGAQSLINAGVPHKVMALRNGTMGWHLAGLELEHGASRRPPPPTPQGLAKARAAAEGVAARAAVRVIDDARLARFRAEADQRSLYVFDVRSPEEYAAGHLAGSRSAPGGQLVQATDAYVGALNARLVLVDDDGIRSLMTASWLLQLGWDEVYAMPKALAGATLEAGAERRQVLSVKTARPSMIAPKELKALLDRGEALVMDLGSSLHYRDGHIPGSRWAIRSRLAAVLPTLPALGQIAVTSSDGRIAELAALDLAALTKIPARALEGGTAAWRAAGLPLVSGAEHMTCPPEDVWYRPYDRAIDREAAMREYLSWEVDLVRQVERDGDARFRVLT